MFCVSREPFVPAFFSLSCTVQGTTLLACVADRNVAHKPVLATVLSRLRPMCPLLHVPWPSSSPKATAFVALLHLFVVRHRGVSLSIRNRRTRRCSSFVPLLLAGTLPPQPTKPLVMCLRTQRPHLASGNFISARRASTPGHRAVLCVVSRRPPTGEVQGCDLECAVVAADPNRT
jgi:hypothetical protein